MRVYRHKLFVELCSDFGSSHSTLLHELGNKVEDQVGIMIRVECDEP